MRLPLPLLFTAWLSACGGRDAPEGTLDDHELTSSNTGERYHLQVFTPDTLTDIDGATVMYIFDGTENIALVLDQYKAALDAGAEPAVLALVPGSNRLTDFTPTPNERGSNGGGQAEFIRFLTDEFAPIVEEGGAGGSPEKRVTFGHSLGGLLSAHLFYDHDFAHRAGIASPSLWWDKGLFFSKTGEAPLNPGPIIVSCGQEEPMGMNVYTRDFADTMQQDYGIDTTYEVFRNKTHQQAFEPALGLAFEELLR